MAGPVGRCYFRNMKLRLVALVALFTTGLLLAAAPASAQRPIPGIKQTAAYKSLKNYVDVLQSKRTVPVTTPRRQTYRANLKTRRQNATTKVLALYSQKLVRLSKQDDKKQRRDVKRIRQNQKAQVQDLKARQATRLAGLQSKQNAAQDRVTATYALRINPLADKRDRLRRQLDKTTKPAKRTALLKQIDKLQRQINVLVNDRQSDLNDVASRFDAKAQSINSLYAAKIAKVKANAARQIKQEQDAWRQTFRAQINAAKDKRDAQKTLVAALAERGSGYIDQMPAAPVS